MVPLTVRVRFAPPAGAPLRLGSLRLALCGWLFARRQGGQFVLHLAPGDAAGTRDQVRSTLRWLGLDWDQDPDATGEPGGDARAQRLAATLLAAGHAYRCFCSAAELARGQDAQVAAGRRPGYDRRCRDLSPALSAQRAAAGAGHALRFAVPAGSVVRDDLLDGPTAVDLTAVEDWVLRRADGVCSADLAQLADDLELRITHGIHGVEHRDRSVRQLLLCRALGVAAPRCAHLPLLCAPDGGRLEPELGRAEVRTFQEQGYLPAALIHPLLAPALAPTAVPRPLSQWVADFALERLAAIGLRLDGAQLRHAGSASLRGLDPDPCLDAALPHLIRAGLGAAGDLAAHRPFLRNLVACARGAVACLQELPAAIAYAVADPVAWDPGARRILAQTPGARALAAQARAHYAALDLPPSFPDDRRGIDAVVALPAAAHPEPAADTPLPFLTPAALEQGSRALAARLGVGFGTLAQVVRALVTGQSHGPELRDALFLAGKARVLLRLAAGAAGNAAEPGA